MNHPIQPLEMKNGVLRFKRNPIVRYLLDHGGIDMNRLAELPFEDADREQFAQLIGYSLGGFSDLSYASEEVYATASLMAEKGQSETAARIAYLEEELAALKLALRAPMARLFGVHPDDLK